MDVGEISLVIAGVVTSAISIDCSLRVPVAIYMMEAGDNELAETSPSQLCTLAQCAGAVIDAGFFSHGSPFAQAVQATGYAAPDVAARPQ